MTETAPENVDIEDLEDGEIESDQENNAAENSAVVAPPPPPVSEEKKTDDGGHKKSSKKSKEHKKPKRRKDSQSPPPPKAGPEDDDFAGSIAKAIKKELKKREDYNPAAPTPNENPADSGVEDSSLVDAKKKHKKRKRHHDEEDQDTKRRRRDRSPDDVDEDEFMCVRGASPVHHQQQQHHHHQHHNRRQWRPTPDRSPDRSRSDDSQERERYQPRYRGFRGRGGNMRGDGRFRSRFRPNQDNSRMQDNDGVCLFYMQGKCYKGDDCAYSHDARPPRKMELCKFYLMDCCAKRDKCLYLHKDFPCKYYHTGIPCPDADDCKFSHGKPLSEVFKQILLKHIESAPKEIIGDFPRLNRESASIMLANTQTRLRQQNNPSDELANEENLHEQQRQNGDDYEDQSEQSSTKKQNARDKSKKSKVRKSRWRDLSPPSGSSGSSKLIAAAENILSIQNLSGVLSPQQISELAVMGITNLNQLSQLTVMQLNKLGITISQINEIQLNTLNIQKLGLLSDETAPKSAQIKTESDLDMRIPPGVPSEAAPIKSEPLGQDVDMRMPPIKKESDIDLDQYTKDAMNFSAFKKSTDNNYGPGLQHEGNVGGADVDHRVLNYVRDASAVNVVLDENAATDTDIRLNMRMHHKHEERARRLTTDDEDDSLHIDEKYYSSDEDDNPKTVVEESKVPETPDATETNTVIKNLGDLSKIDISAEVAKLLSSMKNSGSPETSSTSATSKNDYLKSRDPRNLPKPAAAVGERRDSCEEPSKKITHKAEFVSIYDCVETDNTENTRRRPDVDLRPPVDLDFRLSNFGDTDLRQTPGGSDVDLRLGLPLKLLPNYTPASEIDGSIASHPPISYKVYSIDIPRPNYTDIKNSTLKSQASGDPRLRKIFRLSIDEAPAEIEKQTKASSGTSAAPTRIDPRKRTADVVAEKPPAPKSASLDIQIVIQTSEWYKNLSTNQKILTNQQVAGVTSNLKKFHADKTSNKKFDLTEVKSNGALCFIFNNLGVYLDEGGEFHKFNQQQQKQQQQQQQQQPESLMPNMPPMMGGYNNDMMYPEPNPNFDPRYSSSMMGMNYDAHHTNFSSQDNGYSNSMGMNYDDGYDQMPPARSNDNDYMMMMNDDMDDDYYRNQKNDYNKGNYRWRGGRGGRNRRGGYVDRGNWGGPR